MAENQAVKQPLVSEQKRTLQPCLADFVAKVNGTASVKRILKGWNPTINVQASDTGEKFNFNVKDSMLSQPVVGEGQAGHLITLQALESVLCQVFTGALNPVRANLDGNLAVFANDQDGVKLDAVCLVLWGM
jgi:hypothetical protein